MISKAKTVDEYLQEVPKERFEAMNTIRELFLSELKDYEETMLYGGPCYMNNGATEAGFASQKHLIGVYILKKTVVDKFRDDLVGASLGKGVIRFKRPDKIPFDILRQMLRETFESTENPCL